MRFSQTAVALLVVPLVGTTLACGDTTGPGTPSPTQLRMATFDGAAQQAAAQWFAGALAPAASIDPDTIDTFAITVTRIDYLPAGEDDTDAVEETDAPGGWETLTLDAGATIDLMALPAEGASPIVIASGTIAAGEYRKVRLFISDATISFKGPLTVGQATFDAATDYPVTIPSGAQTGIKTDVGFTVTAGEDAATNAVDVLFDPSATFGNVTATGSGTITMSPVLRARP
ncbi:MAG TPA: DUF4382 domain-containing protein [Gemmatimonadales bacterium]